MFTHQKKHSFFSYNSNTRFWTIFVATIFAAALAGKVTFDASLHYHLTKLRGENERILSIYTDRLNDQINQYGRLPVAIAKDDRVIKFMAQKRWRERDDISQYMSTLNASVGAIQAFLISPDGVIVAASNWNKEGSFIGKNVSYRSYFKLANPIKLTRFSAIGTTDTVPGYYLSSEIISNGKRVGVAALKIGMEQLRHQSLNAAHPMLMTDDNNVIVLSSHVAWEYHRILQSDATEVKKISEKAIQLRYGNNAIKTLKWNIHKKISNDTQLIAIGGEKRQYPYLSITWNIPEIGLRLSVLSDTYSVYQISSAYCVVAMTLVALLSLLFIIIFMRQKVVRERVSHQKNLEAAYKSLEVLVEKRNSELSVTNQTLRREIADRIQAAEQLKAYQQELVRTENLTVIGQLSAGLVHEMNQPLGALNMLSNNTIRFLEKQEYSAVRLNMERISGLVERLELIIHQLRSFARQTTSEAEAVDVRGSVEDALLLLHHKFKQLGVKVTTSFPSDHIAVMCNKTRLEQVLVNLLSNAMDATVGRPDPRVSVKWREDGDDVFIEVSDNGVGFDDAIKKRLFEPFFTTKKTTGLGLGLAISADIIRSYNGHLDGDSIVGEGAIFSIVLPRYISDGALDDRR